MRMKKMTKKHARVCLSFGAAICFLIAGLLDQEMLKTVLGLLWIAVAFLQMKK